MDWYIFTGASELRENLRTYFRAYFQPRVLMIHEVLLINIFSAFFSLDNKLYKIHGTYIKIKLIICCIFRKDFLKREQR
jgi:hypothetical protein